MSVIIFKWLYMNIKNIKYLILIFSVIYANSSGPPSGYANNAPNYSNCTICHSGNVNSGNGSISFLGLPQFYSPGETYSIQVVVSGENSRGYGFQAIAMSNDDVAGSISLNSSNTEINGSYVQQSTRTDNGSWVFDWVAPSSDFGEITFSGSGLATGGNSGTGGDHVFVTSTSVSPQQVSTQNDEINMKFLLHQNYPNPFNPLTKLSYNLPQSNLVTITIYDMIGNVVNNLLNEYQEIGYKSIVWDATNNNKEPVSSGFYFYTIQTGEFSETKKMILIK